MSDLSQRISRLVEDSDDFNKLEDRLIGGMLYRIVRYSNIISARWRINEPA